MKDIQRINAIADVQSSRDLYNLPINQVDIKGLRFPISLRSKEGKQSTVAHLTMIVFLPADQKDTCMSCLVALVEKQTNALDFNTPHKLTAGVTALLDSHFGKVSMSLPPFREESAPISGIQSLLDYDVTLTSETKNGTYSHSLKMMAPVTSLCPYSKKASQYGAHNQRSHVTVSLIANADVGIEEIIDYAEAQTSCQLYGLFKRPDEKYVTERAYENPKFVEDIVRDVTTVLIADKRTESFIVESGNFESIHNRSTRAYIAYP